MDTKKTNKLGFANWFTYLVAGLVGQFAWTIENMYLNRYLFHLTDSADFIKIMVAASALAATLTTLLMGALCDRLGKRKPFIVIGYIIWGISIVSFAFLDNDALKTAGMIGPLIVILDCLMTFFGSSANDAAFNAYVTDTTDDTNRGKVESILSVLPLVAMLIIFGLIDGTLGLNKKESANWPLFYYIFGGITILIGVILIFVMPKDKIKPNKDEPYIKNIFYGFRPKVIKQNPMLYVVLTAFAIFSIGVQVFYPYFIIYIQENLKIVDEFVLVMGGVLVSACIITVIFGFFMDKIGKNKVLIPSIVLTSIGCILMFFAREIGFLIPSGIIMMSGLMISQAAFGAKIRDYTPVKEVGLFQGIRMVFVVLIPMFIGPLLSEALYKNLNPAEYINEYGEVTALPNEWIFLGAALVMLLSLIPVIIMVVKEFKNGKEHTA